MSMESRSNDASSKLIPPGVQKNTNPIIEWTIIISCTNISHI